MNPTADSIVVADSGTATRSKRRRRRGPSPSGSPEPAPARPSTLLPFASHPPYDPTESIDTALARYKAWMREGAPRDGNCFVCHEPGGIDCNTCRRSYHDRCRSIETPGSYRNSAWYCHICVGRGWSANPPSLTPPASPTQTPAAAPATERRPLPSSRQPAEAPLPPQRRKSPKAPSTAGPSTLEPPGRARAARKSRYTTLPGDVDNALRVLYTELESASERERQVVRLAADVTRLEQELELARKQADLERKASQSVHVLQQELSRLQREAAQNQAALDGMASLMLEKQQAEAELKDTRTELDKLKKTMEDWRRKLSSLVDG